MKKFLLVVFIGIVLSMNVYAMVNKFLMHNEIQDVKDEVFTIVYVE